MGPPCTPIVQLATLVVPMGVLAPYDSPERKAYGAKFKDAKNFWTSMTSNYFVLGYHLRFVPRGDAPKDWPDLLQPKWKGKLGMDPEEYDWLGGCARGWVRRKRPG